jgi:hypothetical protein
VAEAQAVAGALAVASRESVLTALPEGALVAVGAALEMVEQGLAEGVGVREAPPPPLGVLAALREAVGEGQEEGEGERVMDTLTLVEAEMLREVEALGEGVKEALGLPLGTEVALTRGVSVAWEEALAPALALAALLALLLTLCEPCALCVTLGVWVCEGEGVRVYCAAGREGEEAGEAEAAALPVAFTVGVTLSVGEAVPLTLPEESEVAVALALPEAPSCGEAEVVGEGDTVAVARGVKLELPMLAVTEAVGLPVGAEEALALVLGVPVVL